MHLPITVMTARTIVQSAVMGAALCVRMGTYWMREDAMRSVGQLGMFHTMIYVDNVMRVVCLVVVAYIIV